MNCDEEEEDDEMDVDAGIDDVADDVDANMEVGGKLGSRLFSSPVVFDDDDDCPCNEELSIPNPLLLPS